MTSLNNHILFSLAVRNRLPKPDRSSYKLQFDKIFAARSIFQKKIPKREKKSSNHSMYFFNCRSGVVCQNRTDQVISCNFTNFLMRARFFTNFCKKNKKTSSNHSMYIFPCRSGVVFQNRTDQVISYNLTNFLMRLQFFTI